MPHVLDPAAGPLPGNARSSRDGLRRVRDALRCPAAGRRAAVRHEAAFGQELPAGVPLVAAAWWPVKASLQALGSAAVLPCIALAATTGVALLWH